MADHPPSARLRNVRALLAAAPAFLAAAPAASQPQGVARPRPAVGASPQVEYGFVREGNEWVARNRKQAFRARASIQGVRVEPYDGAAWSLRLSTTRFGRGAGEPAEAGSLHAVGERVELVRDGWTEWFVNDERGLEHGWTLESPPAGDGPLWLGLSFGGELVVRITEDGRSAALHDAEGERVLDYRGLRAWDAAGRPLEARLLASPHGAGIRVEDAGADYPVTVDPVVVGPVWEVLGGQAGEQFAYSVSTAGDVNGDGYSDTLVGASRYDADGLVDAGRVYLFLGGPGGPSLVPDWTFEGDRAGMQLGFSVSAAGDIGGDGYDDFVVGAPYRTETLGGQGRAYVFAGGPGGPAAVPDWFADGEQSGANFGYSVSMAGFLQGDDASLEWMDVVIGAPHHDVAGANDGRVYVFPGGPADVPVSPPWVFDGEQSGSSFGSSVSAAGDTDWDGFPEFAVGAPGYDAPGGGWNHGRVYLFEGAGFAPSTTPVFVATGTQAYERLGTSVAFVGSVNGDLAADLAVGAPGHSSGGTAEGMVRLYFGSENAGFPAGTQDLLGTQDLSGFGEAVSSAGDVDGDGIGDLLIGAPRHQDDQLDEGAAFLYLGRPFLSLTEHLQLAVGQLFYGSAVGAAGDVDGDGYGDFLVGGDTEPTTSGTGLAHLYRGGPQGLDGTARWTATGPAGGSEFTKSMDFAGDVDGDGFSDLIVGAPGAGGTGGQVFLYRGGVVGPSATSWWSDVGFGLPGEYFGEAVAGVGDVDGDGYDDVAVGAPLVDWPLPPYAGTNNGAWLLYRGGPTGMTYDRLETGYDGQRLGTAISGMGDIDGDGFCDFVVSAPGMEWILVYRGGSDGPALSQTIHGPDTHPGVFGFDVLMAGDVNGDGYGDVLIADPYIDNVGTAIPMGKLYFYPGSPSGLPSSPTWTWEATQDNALLGFSIARAGDVNGDSYSDLVVGEPGYDGTFARGGRAHVLLGSPGGPVLPPVWTVEGLATDADLGRSVAGGFDVNGDHLSDVVVGSPRDLSGRGRSFVHLGTATGVSTTPHRQIWGFIERSGWSVSSAGDFNGDGFGDLVLGESYASGLGFASIHLGNRSAEAVRPLRQFDPTQLDYFTLLGRSAPFVVTARIGGFLPDRASWGPAGRARHSADIEVEPFGTAFDGDGIMSGPFFPSSIASASDETLLTDTLYHWRVRSTTTYPQFPHGPWTSLPGNAITEAKFRTSPDCNGNGIDDLDDLANGDCNANGVPDDCDPDTDQNGVPDDCPGGIGTPYCFGDGSAGPCPCGNASPPGEGCLHSGGLGMTIRAEGSVSIAADDLTVVVEQVPPDNGGLIYSGTEALDPPNLIWDGLQCALGDTRRYQPQFQSDGVFTDTGFVAQDPTGVYFAPGTTYNFQLWTRDASTGSSPCGTFANYSPAISVRMVP